MEWLDNALYWHWWVVAVAFIILEAFSPGVFLIWMGVGAGAVGFVLLAWPGLDWAYQLMIFALVSVSSILIWRQVLERRPIATDQPRLNRRGEQYIGRLFTLDEPVVNGLGKIRVDDSTWKIEGPDCEAGSRVEVTGVDGVVLKVEVVG